MNTEIRALLIEDNADDALLMQTELAQSDRVSCEVIWTERLSAGLERLDDADFDVVLLDLGLPDSQGIATLRTVQDHSADVPVVVLTGLDDHAVAYELVKGGAQDHLVKGKVGGGLLVRSMLNAVERHSLLAELHLAKESAEARLRAVVDNTPVIMFALDISGVFTLCEGRGLAALRRSTADIVGHLVFDVFRRVPGILENVRAALGGESRSFVVPVEAGTLEAYLEPLRGPNDEIVGVVGVAHDITERKRLEEQFFQSQKMEAVGQLAGGVAHDFNNLLSGIMGYTQLALGGIGTDHALSGHFMEIQKAADRAASLTRQLLAFSRRQIAEPRVLRPTDLILDMDSLFRRLVGEDVELVMLPAEDSWPVRIDPSHMEQMLVNLVVNARQAMPDGGKLIVETANCLCREASDGHEAVLGSSGEWVTISVTDTGVGMTDAVKARVFEPFFSTKEVGKGTGLGLSTCYGMAVQSGGHIAVEIEPGRGTTFNVYLPKVDQPPDPLSARDDTGSLPVGEETVLLAEDEPLVREVAAHVLREQGYTVLEAANGHEALGIAQNADAKTIDLLLTDVVMPLMGGRQLADLLRQTHEGARLLYTSGYTDDAIVSRQLLEDGTEFMQKPFTPASLAWKVREVLDR